MERFLLLRAAALGHYQSRLSATDSLSSEATRLRYAIKNEPNTTKVRAAVRALVAQQGGDRACLEKAIDEDGRTPVYLAASWYRGDVIGMLLQEGASPNTPAGRDGDTALARASRDGREEVVQQLLSAGASVDTASPKRRITPLHEACRGGHATIARHLLSAGADIESRNEQAWTAIHFAAFYGHLFVVRALADAGACLDAPEGMVSASPLCLASQRGHSQVVEALLSAGAKVDMLAADGSSPLHFAAVAGHVAVIRVLISAGAQVDSRSVGSLPSTPLLLAADYNREGAMQELLRAGASAAEALKLARERGWLEDSDRLVGAYEHFVRGRDAAVRSS